MRLLNLFPLPGGRHGILVNSLPKAGTNLLSKVTGLLPSVRDAGLHVMGGAAAREPADPGEPRVPIDAGCLASVPLGHLHRQLQQVGGRRFATAHLPFSAEAARLLDRLRIKTLLILRDPRDVVVSLAHYTGTNPKLRLHRFLGPLSAADRLLSCITGFDHARPAGPRLLDIGEQLRRLLPWTAEPSTYTTRYERLVGPKGNGTRADQLAELAGISRHLRLRVGRRRLERIADRAYGGTATFRSGGSGGWRAHFSPAHTAAFKAVCGQLLIDLGYEKDLRWEASDAVTAPLRGERRAA